MNRCEEVLKHSTNKGLKIEKDELYHSDTYLGSEYDEGLKHFKYIKRYRNSKGKWTYVYASHNTHKNLKNARKIAKVERAKADWFSDGSKDRRSLNARVNDMKSAKEHLDNSNKINKEVDAYINKNDIVKNIKRKVNKASMAVKYISKDSVKRGTDFIEKIMKNFK